MRVQVDRRELQKLSLDFRRVASELLRTSHDDADANLRRFMAFIDRDAIIGGFIQEKLELVDLGTLMIEHSDYDQRWIIPDDPDLQVAYVYHLLSETTKPESDLDYFRISYYYNRGSSKIQDRVNAFNKSVVQPFVAHINSFVEKLMIDAGLHERGASVSVSSGGMYVQQALGSNLASGSATISESTASYTDARSLVEGVHKLRDYMDDVPDDKKREVEEAIDVLVTSASGEIVPRSVIAEKVELVGNSSPQMQSHLKQLAVGAGSGLASHGIIQAIQFIFERITGS